jgi:small subunit ribosomal protein S21
VFVRVIDGDIRRAIGKLKTKVSKDGIFRDLKLRELYPKPSESKKAKQRIAERRRRKRLKFQEWKGKARC